jgi:phosphoglycerate dehydrogenase-like enzyme
MINCIVDGNIKWSEQNRRSMSSMGVCFKEYDGNSEDLEKADCLLWHSPLDDTTLSKMTNCRYIGVRARNTDYINGHLAHNMGIVVQGLSKQHGVTSVAEHTLALILGLSKNLFFAGDNFKKGAWREDLGAGFELRGRKLGIIGYGAIGQRVGELGIALGMELLIAAKPGERKEGRIELERLLKESDVITLHLSTNKGNEKYIGAYELKLIKDDALIINTARGSVMDYEALKDELEKGRFRGVGLDVFPHEPVAEKDFLPWERVIATPHTAFLTEETLERMNNELLENLKSRIQLFEENRSH